MKTRDDAVALLHEFVQNENLRKHMYAVEAAMRYYAEYFGEDADRWAQAGLLHDFDYERYPSMEDHPFRGAEILRQRGYDEDFVQTILAHATHTGVPRDTLAKKVLFAVDELSGFIVAVTLVRPSKSVSDVRVSSVTKKLKDKAFARQVNREEIYQGADEIGMPLPDHIQHVITALQQNKTLLGI